MTRGYDLKIEFQKDPFIFPIVFTQILVLLFTGSIFYTLISGLIATILVHLKIKLKRK